MSECRQQHTLKFCNCSVGFQFPAKNYPECNVSGMKCLIEYNDLLNAEKPVTKNPFFNEAEEGMTCQCLPECTRLDYSVEISPIYDEKKINSSFVLIDVHYASQSMMKYRTDVTFSKMDLVVGFGGIVSLFLGASLISGAEVLYFSTVALICHRKRSLSTKKDLFGKIKARFPFVH
jgi:acid-sensing ion channel, other